jgi:SAM-dependent methyltransferase
MYEESIRSEFTHQTDTFARARALLGESALGTLVDLVPDDPEARWLEVACGPAAIGRTLAPRLGAVHGVDMTEAMVAKAREEAAAEGLANAEFSLGDATALEFEDASFDGAITRFSLHHIPAPGRVLEEMARVVRPGGWVVVSDHVTDEDREASAWHEEIERLRDPSHWACLTPGRLQALAARAGLEPDTERLVPFELDFAAWRDRSSGGPGAAGLIDRLLDEAPASAERFRVLGEGAERTLALVISVNRWHRP